MDEIYLIGCGFKYCISVNVLILNIVLRLCKSIFLFLEYNPQGIKGKGTIHLPASDSQMIQGG